MRLIEKVWFHQHSARWFLVPLLLPVSLLFLLLSTLRRLAFKYNISTSYHVDKPVIVVGNIGVGGNGKTPVVIYLVQLAQQLGFTPGVISRGYGAKAPYYPYLLNTESTTNEAGDEPILIYNRCRVPVVVGSDRVANAERLIAQGCDLIISDDGLQHYRLQRDIELIIVDSKRLFGNGLLLPSGPLREGTWRLKQADAVIYNGSSALTKSTTQKVNANKSDSNTDNIANLMMTLQATQVCQLSTGKILSISDFIDEYAKINAIAGIGDPQRFFNTLKEKNFSINESRGFVDHHHFVLSDFNDFSDDFPLLMTEKDAVKCQYFAQPHWWYLPVDAQLSAVDEKILIDKLQALSKAPVKNESPIL